MESEPSVQPANNLWNTVRKTLLILGSLLLFMFAIELMVTSLQRLGSNVAETLFLATANPFTAFFIGLLITAMVQSSSTTTSISVALVASGSIPFENAVPVIMGANVGTTITSTIVSLGFMNKKKEFRRAVAAGTYHDIFNILTAVILFPLEYNFRILSGLSGYIKQSFFNDSDVPPIGLYTHGWGLFDPAIDFFVATVSSGVVLAALSFLLLFSMIILFRKLISGLLLGQSPGRFSRFFFLSPIKSFLWGMGITAAIRSSTVTTSLVVPLAANKVVPLKRAAPFILGANMGTTVTAFIAAIINTSSSSAIGIAIAHFLFNLIGVLIFFPIPILRKIPVQLANGFGNLAVRYRIAVLIYMLVVFFFIPFVLIYLNRN